ncbi:helix-turn-helix transcriptional regulator [Haloplanus halobius]|uniref:helix-turn-helix transcriptional regulator n=1 Tax=Haloplanus halobius TaxID=2934938 RepID=UPI00200E0228|nr:transcriptional regulator FilR1 domain-containing protein [Haloplanus sp. XH21]
MPSDETAQFLAGSPDRRRLLDHLADHPGTPAALAETLPLSRRSVQRHLSQFADRGWVEKDEGSYRLTVTGELVVAEHAAYRERLDRIETFRPLFDELPDRAHAPDPRWLTGATLVTATSTNPQAPVRAYADAVRALETDHVRMLSPILSRSFHDAHARLASAGVYTELVMDAATIKRASDLNPGEFEVIVGLDVLDLYRHPSPIQFGLTLGDERTVMGAYDEDGTLRACVTSANEAFRAWGDDLFDRYRDRAEPVDSAVPFR